MNSLKKAAVLYHYPCPDGAFAALAAHLYFSAASLPVAFFPNPVYDPIRVESLPFDELSDIYLLDFIGASGFVAEISSKVDSVTILEHLKTALETISGNVSILRTVSNVIYIDRSWATIVYDYFNEKLIRLNMITLNVTILDHHKTALETISGNLSVLRNVSNVIDMDRSGATIAYDYFNEKLIRRGISLGNHGGVCNGQFLPENKVEKVQRLFKFIEDGDLWRWELPHSKAFSSGLADMKIEYNVNVNSSLFDQLMDLDPEFVISHGKETLARKQKLIDSALDHSYEIALGCGLFGHCLAVDADFISELRSELGHQLANKSRNLNLRSIGAVVYKVPELKNDQLLKISLRSIELEDTTAISKEFGGGGHRNASSFILSADEFSKWKV